MGLWSFFKGLFTGEDEELDALRAKHNIRTGGEGTEKGGAARRARAEAEVNAAWDELRDYHWNFFFGRWATRKFRRFSEDKLKEDLEKLEKKEE